MRGTHDAQPRRGGLAPHWTTARTLSLPHKRAGGCTEQGPRHRAKSINQRCPSMPQESPSLRLAVQVSRRRVRLAACSQTVKVSMPRLRAALRPKPHLLHTVASLRLIISMMAESQALPLRIAIGGQSSIDSAPYIRNLSTGSAVLGGPPVVWAVTGRLPPRLASFHCWPGNLGPRRVSAGQGRDAEASSAGEE